MKAKFIILILFISFLNNCGDYYEEFSGGYTYNSEGRNWNYIFKGDKVIPCDVISFDYDDDYIIAIQRVKDEDCMESKNIVIKNPIGTLNYWIADIAKDKLYGPMSLDEFVKLRKKLNVDESLQFKM